jgi:hypothetical protein
MDPHVYRVVCRKPADQTEMFHDTYEELDSAEMAIYRIKEKR